jgi:hypothetical protein
VTGSVFESTADASSSGSVGESGILLSASASASLTFDIDGTGTGNTFTNFAPNINTTGKEAINLLLNADTTTGSVTNGKIRGNTFADSGGAVGMDAGGAGLARILIDSNIANTSRQGIYIDIGGVPGDAVDMDLTITNNTVTVVANDGGWYDAIVFAAMDATNGCLNIRGNTAVASSPSFASDISLVNYTNPFAVFLESGPTDCGGSACADVDAALLANNTITTAGTDPWLLVAPGTCLTPP